MRAYNYTHSALIFVSVDSFSTVYWYDVCQVGPTYPLGLEPKLYLFPCVYESSEGSYRSTHMRRLVLAFPVNIIKWATTGPPAKCHPNDISLVGR